MTIHKGIKAQIKEAKEIQEKIKSGKMKIEFAQESKINKYLHSNLSKKFIEEVLFYKEEDILISDLSRLTDFPHDEDFYLKKIKKVFGVTVKGDKFIWQILKQIKDTVYK